MFDVNDFDETLPGPWEWDIKRLAASMLIAARDNGFRAKEQDRIVLDTVGRYRSAMAEFAAMKQLDVWYSHLDIESVFQEFASQFKPKLVKRADKQLAKARTKDSMTAFSKLTEVVDGKTRIVDQSPLIVPAGSSPAATSSSGCTACCRGCCAATVRRLSSTAVCCSSSSS